MWKCYEQEQSPLKKVVILEKIASVQPYLSAYYEAMKMVKRESGSVINNSSSFESSDDIQDEPLHHIIDRYQVIIFFLFWLWVYTRL